MTSSEIVRLPFDKAEIGVWARSGDKRITNWPVIYILDDDTTNDDTTKASATRAFDRRKRPKQEQRRKIYVGESLNVTAGRRR